MVRAVSCAVLWMSTGLPAVVLAQAPPVPDSAAAPRPTPAPPIVSPEVHADRKVTFRLRAPAAKEVLVSGEWSRDKTPMVKDEKTGDWSATLGPLEADLYGYSFTMDGFAMVDPSNSQVKVARSPRTSILDVPADPPRMHDVQAVPRGTVRIHTYDSKSLGRRRGLYVYTPPGYDKDDAQRYPVLYLLHGAGDNEATWVSLGRTHVILDNLLAARKGRPMLVVMADGHPIYPTPSTPEGRMQNAEAFERDLIEDALPFVEANYRVDRRAEGRAVTGVSMGGGHALMFGLRHPDVFGWIVGLSSSVFDPEATLAKTLADPKGTNARLKHLSFTVGKSDPLLEGNQKLADLLKAKGITHTFTPIDGEHNWRQWRRYLIDVVPTLFVDAKRQLTASPAPAPR
jgi:enterochelin esterase-like enzyme